MTILQHRLAPVSLDFAAAVEEAPAPPEVAPAPAGDARPGFRRNGLGHLLLVLAGLMPLMMLAAYLLRSGLGMSMTVSVFLGLYAVGYACSVMQLLYAMRLPPSQFVPFSVRSFYGLPELIAVAVVLVPAGIWNLLQVRSGASLTLSKVLTTGNGDFGQSALFLG